MIRLVLFLVAASGWAQAPEMARRWRAAHEAEILAEFQRLLAIPNVASNLDDMERNADLITAMFARRGVKLEKLRARRGPPAMFGEMATPGARRTVVFYVHYDGQPVDPARWTVTKPFEPVVRDGRVWARSASDDKAPLMALLAALDSGVKPRANIKFFFDGEEEANSTNLGEIVAANRERLKADAWIFCDGPVHQNRQQQVVFGVRGVTGLQVTVYGARRELHSGHYGNWAPNPAAMLAHLVASMRDEDTGRVLIKDFYADTEPLGPEERRALAEAPRFDDELRAELGLARTESGGERLDEAILKPALNIQGIGAAAVGEGTRNVVPATATVALSVRLVRGNDWRRMQDRVIAHIRARGYHVVETEPDMETRRRYPKIARVTRGEGYNAVRAPMDSGIARSVVAAVESARGRVIRLPSMGGSLPIAPIYEVLRAPVIIVPIANHDNNQHGHDENIRLANLWDGIETMAALLAMN